MNLKFRAIDLAYWLGWNVLWRIPTGISYRLFNFAGKLAWKKNIKGVRQLELNLSRVLGCEVTDPRIRPLSLLTMQSYMRYYCETFLLPRWSSDEIQGKVRAENPEPLSKALQSGGAIIVLPHLANWDLAGAWAALYFGSLCTVAERLRPEGVFQKFLAARAALGINIKALSGDGGSYEFLRDHVFEGRLVALLGDRDVAKTGMGNNFFGHRALIPVGAALLALDTGRPLYTCGPWYDGKTLVITFDDEIIFDRSAAKGKDRLRRAREISEQVVVNLEKHILAHPDNWHQLQPVWPDLVATDVVAK